MGHVTPGGLRRDVPAGRAAGGAEPGVAAWCAGVLATALLLLLPLAVVDLPPLLDYPNHLARMLVLARGAEDPVLSRFWLPSWGILPNLATDLVLPPLARLMPIAVAGKLVLGALLLLLLAGMVAFHRAAFGVRSWWPLAGALVAYNALFLAGFMNFVAGLGLALLVAALWVKMRETRPALAVAGTALGMAALFFCHLLAVVFAALLVAMQEVVALAATRRQGAPLLPAILRRAGGLALVLLPPAALYLSAPISGAEGPTCWLPASHKAVALLTPVLNYHGALDVLAAGAVLGLLALGRWRGRGRVDPASLLAILLLLALTAVAPFMAKGGSHLDSRFPVMIGLLLFAGFDPRLPRRLARIAALAVAGLLVLRMGVVGQVWSGHAADLAQLRASIAAIDPGSRVLVASAEREATPAYWARSPRSRVITRFSTAFNHLGALVVLERRAFIPLLFAEPSQQPIRLRPPYDRLAVPVGLPPDYRLLARESWTAAELAKAPYLPGWEQGFDHVLVLLADAAPGLPGFLPDRLQPVNATGMAALFRVRPEAGASVGPIALPPPSAAGCDLG